MEQTLEDNKDFGKQRRVMEDFREKKSCEGKTGLENPRSGYLGVKR